MYHFDKQETFERAKKLIEENTPASLRYACLELRYCIEQICYEKLKLYEKQLPNSAFNTWQPKRVIDMLTEYDPYVMENYEISFWSEKSDGSVGNFILGGKHTNLPISVIAKHYYKLGHYLHVPTLAQQKDEIIDNQELKRYLQAIIPDISSAAANTFNSNLSLVAHCKCKACGQVIIRNVESIKRNPVVMCTNEHCKALYDVTVEEEKTTWKLRELNFECPNCKKENYLGLHHLKEKQIIKCFSCSKRYVLFQQWHFSELGEGK